MSAGLVLVVDDEVDIRETMQTVLEISGYEVSVAKDGAEALARLREGPRPCLILLDLMMPNMNGSEFRAAQLADQALADIPVVALSGDTRGPRLAEELQIEVLKKPIDLAELVGRVEQFCGGPPPPSKSTAASPRSGS